MMKKRFLALFLAAVMLFSLATPALAADPTGSYVRIEVSARKYCADFTAYSSEKAALQHKITLRVEENDFPVTAKLVGKNGHSKSFTFNTYGTKRLQVDDTDDLLGVSALGLAVISFGLFTPMVYAVKETCYAYVEIAPPQPASSATTSSNQTTTSSPSLPSTPTLDERYQQVLNEVGFPFTYREYSTYAKELKAFFTGDWNGRLITGDNWGGYSASRSVDNRVYTWIANNLYTGEAYHLSVNVDYIGYKEVIPGVTSKQDYSLAVDYVNDIIEQWSFLERRNRWQLDLVGETIHQIVPLGVKGDGAEACQVLVITYDTDGVEHLYSLMPGDKVEQTL